MNKINYDKKLSELIKTFDKKPTLLLHACCAPCASAVLEYLDEYFEITVFYDNSNILSEEEFIKRSDEMKRFLFEAGYSDHIGLIIPEYRHNDFLEMSKGLENEPEKGSRCMLCYKMRLENTAIIASEKQFDYFCTTLSISPLKDAGAINRIGDFLGKKYNTTFLPSDFKKKGRYLRSIELSSIYGLYRQNFCGCEFSLPSR